MSIYEVTQAQFEIVMGANPSHFKGADNPVDQVTWDEAAEYCHRLSELPEEKAAGHAYRLPTESEWEYACRAGSDAAFSFGNDPAAIGEYAWFLANSGGTSHPVGQKKPNAWGLYDMHGNVFEWCFDWYSSGPTPVSTDPQGAKSGLGRVLRGGAWYNGEKLQRSANRGKNQPGHRDHGYGFRVVRSLRATEIVMDAGAAVPLDVELQSDDAVRREIRELRILSKQVGIDSRLVFSQYDPPPKYGVDIWAEVQVLDDTTLESSEDRIRLRELLMQLKSFNDKLR
jgi:hypothetical protein